MMKKELCTNNTCSGKQKETSIVRQDVVFIYHVALTIIGNIFKPRVSQRDYY